MKFTQIPVDAFSTMQLNAGVMLTDFDVSAGSFDNEDMLGATTGGVSASAVPSFSDMGDGIDNAPVNVLEMKKIDSWECSISGTLLTTTPETTALLMGAADVSGDKITPRKDLKKADFKDIWWVGDYSDVNTGATAGYVAIHVMNALSTGGFSLQSNDKGKGNFAFNFVGHVSIDAQDVVPFEVYVHKGVGA